jgi:CheY-like chemotaxis protein/nitrogen-specific signal transduction histidine kinase
MSIRDVGKKDSIQLVKDIEQSTSADKAKDTFLATMSHELRTPLNGIMGMVTMLPDAGPLNKKQLEYVKILTECSLHLANLLNNILDFSKMASDRLVLHHHPFYVNKTVLEAIKMVEGTASAKGLALDYKIPSNLPMMIGDSQRLIQILSNILGNAVKFTEKGSITLMSYAEKVDDVDEYVRKWKLTFIISDTGIGIPPDEKEKIFEVFHQASTLNTYLSKLGTGLGLSIVRELTRLMGGNISVESEGIVGKGSTFTFFIVATEDIDINKLSEVHHDILENSSILVVDDRQEMRLQICDMLFKWKCRPTAVGSAEEALHYLKNGLRFNLAVVDICMPYMSGVELAQELRRSYPSLPLIAISSMDINGGEKYFDYYMNKPVDPNKLFLALIGCLMGEQGTKKGSPKKRPILNNSPRKRTMKYRDKLNILVAEDNAQNIFTILEMLKNLGYNKKRVTIVENGKECVEEVKMKNYDVILMDLLMPILSGFEATKHIRQMEHSPMIIAVSAAVTDADKANCQKIGFDGYLSKPIIHKDKLDAALSPLVKERKEGTIHRRKSTKILDPTIKKK